MWFVRELIWLVLVVKLAAAVDHTVGGPGGWTLGTDFAAWASSQTFRVGDNLVFHYGSVHSVVEVMKSDYDSCQLGKAIATYFDSSTTITLTAPGKRYFICATPGHCGGGMKLQVDTVPPPSSPPPRSPPPPPPPSPSTPPPSPPSSHPPPKAPSTPPPVSSASPPPKAPSTPPPPVSSTSPPPKAPSTPPPPVSLTSPPPKAPSTPPPVSSASPPTLESPASSPPKESTHSPGPAPRTEETPKSSANRGGVFCMGGWLIGVLTLFLYAFYCSQLLVCMQWMR